MTLRDAGNDTGEPERLPVGAIGVDGVTFTF